MSYIFSKSTPATSGEALYNFKTLLKSAGWVVKSSGDATTYNSSGDQITSGTSGSGGFNNTNAWVRLQAPDGYQEFTIQKGGGTTGVNITYSLAAHFIGGSPSSTVVPTATDEQSISSGGFFQNNGTYRYMVCADNEFPYTFWSAAYQIGGTLTVPGYGAFFALEFFLNTESTDVNKYMVLKCNGQNPFSIANLGITDQTRTSASGVRSLTTVASADSSNLVYIEISAVFYGFDTVTNLYPDGGTTNPINGKAESISIMWARSGVTNLGYKGIGSIVKWNSIPKKTGDTLTVVTDRDRIVYGSANLPWDGSIPEI